MKWIKTFESVQSQKILEQVRVDTLKLMSKETFKNCISTKEDGTKYFINLSGVDLLDLDKSKYDEETVKFITETKLYVSPKRSIPSSFGEGNSKGSFLRHQKSIYLHVTDEFLAKINDELQNPPVYGEHIMHLTDDKLYFDLWYEFHSTLLHELQHAWDNWKSKGGYTRNKKYFKYVDKLEKLPQHNFDVKYKLKDIDKSEMDIVDKEKEKEKIYKHDYDVKNKAFKQYQNMQHEINARFAQAIQDTKFWTMDKLSKDYKRVKVPFAEVLQDFKYSFQGWRDLSANNKLRLTKRLAQFYTDNWGEIKKKAEDDDKEV